MTTLVYQNGTLYADTKFTKAMERTGLTFEEAYQASLANAKYAVEFGMTELEYKQYSLTLTYSGGLYGY